MPTVIFFSEFDTSLLLVKKTKTRCDVSVFVPRCPFRRDSERISVATWSANNKSRSNWIENDREIHSGKRKGVEQAGLAL